MLDELQSNEHEITLVNNAVPRFDFSDLSWGDSMKLTEAQTIILELVGVEKINSAQARDMYTAFMNITEYLARVCTHVPQSWLTKNAPEGMDFSDPAAFGFVKQKNVGKLMQDMATAQAAEKNE